MQETLVPSLGQENPLEKGMEPTPIFLPGESRGQRSLAGHRPLGCEESFSDTTERLKQATAASTACLCAGRKRRSENGSVYTKAALFINQNAGVWNPLRKGLRCSLVPPSPRVAPSLQGRRSLWLVLQEV